MSFLDAAMSRPSVRSHKVGEKLTIQDLPMELIVHTFSFLDAASLIKASQTCKYWQHLVESEAVWKHALERHFSRLPQTRCSATWKEEYLARSQLERVWGYDPMGIRSLNFTIGPLGSAYVDPSGDWMVGINPITGMAQAGDFRTVKITKAPIYPDRTHTPRSTPHTLVGSHQIVWGHGNGLLTTISLDREGTLSRRARESSIRHQGAISTLSWDPQRPQWVVSGCIAGQVILWALPNLEPLLFLTGLPPGARVQDLLFSPTHHVLALTQTCLYMWSLDVSSLKREENPPAQVSSRPPTKILPLRPPSTISFRATKMVQGLRVGEVIILGKDEEYSIWGLDVHSGTFFTRYTLPGSVPLSPGGPLVTLPESGSLAYGESHGSVRIWDMVSYTSSKEDTPSLTLTPVAINLLGGHRGQRITSVTGNSHVLLSSALDGHVCIWDAVGGRLLRSLRSKSRRGGGRPGGEAGIGAGAGGGEGIQGPQGLYLLSRGILALSGDQAKLWAFDLSGRRRKGLSTSLSPRPGASRSGGMDRKEMTMHLREDLAHVRQEQEEALEASRKRVDMHKRLQGMDLTDLTDEELVQYVSMLSLETGREEEGEDPEAQGMPSQETTENDEEREARELEFAIQLSMVDSQPSPWKEDEEEKEEEKL